MRSTTLRRSVAALAAATMGGLLAPMTAAHANGNESLGPPVGITIAQGSGIVTGGTGLLSQPGVINVNVPAGAAVKQVLLYWNGYHSSPSGDSTITVNGNGISGALIGGPDFFFPNFDVNPATSVYSSSFRADITALGLVGSGANALSVSGLTNDFRNNGAGVVVVVDDGSGAANIQVRDGDDNAFNGFPAGEPRQDTVAQTFTVAPAVAARAGIMSVNVASVNPNRANTIDITVGGTTTTLVDPLGDNKGAEWDTRDIPVTIPAGVTSVTVKVNSANDGTGKEPASLTWVSATLSVKSAVDPCTAPSNTPAITHGSAYSLDATLLGLHPINKAGQVDTVAPGAPANQAKQLANLNVVGLVSAGLLNTQSNSTLSPSTSTASATVANVNLLNGLVKATTIRGISQSVASTSGSSYNSNGSVIQGLTVNNIAVPVAPNTTVAVKDPLFPSQTVAELHIYEETGTSTFANGVSKSSHAVNMLRLVVLKPLLGLPAGATVTVAHAQSDAQSPTVGCPGLKRVSGEAFTAFANGNLAGQNLVNVKVGDAVLPSTGGSNSDGTLANVPGVATSATAANTTSGSLLPSPNATARSVVEQAKVLGTVVTADVLDVKSTSSANGTTAGTTFTTTFANLVVGGVPVNATVSPNTQIIVNLGAGTYVSVTLNEQTVTTNGTTDTAGTVNAVHVRVFAAGGLLTGEVIVASAHSDAHSS